MQCNYTRLDYVKYCHDSNYSLVIKDDENGRNYPTCTNGEKFSTDTNLDNYCARSDDDRWFHGVDKNGNSIAIQKCNNPIDPIDY